METVILVFMAFVSVVTLLVVLVVIKDILQGAFKKDKTQQKVEDVTAVEVEKVIEPVTEEEKVDDNAIVFSAGSSKSHTDKYIDLKTSEKAYYDEIIRYVQQIDGVKRNLNDRYEDYKVGITRLIRLRIKKDTILAELILPNSDFKYYVSDNKVDVKLAPTVIKVISWESVKVVKDSLDIVVKAIAEEKERKKEIARKKRKARRLAQKV